MKKLYRYDFNFRLEEHQLTSDCIPIPVDDSNSPDLMRCSHHKRYGYLLKRYAKKEAVDRARQEIAKQRAWIEKLGGTP